MANKVVKAKKQLAHKRTLGSVISFEKEKNLLKAGVFQLRG